MRVQHVDKFFLTVIVLLVIAGFIIFSSASLGLLARDGASFISVASRQVVLGIVLGGIAMGVFSRIDYTIWRKYSIYFFLLALLATAAVFIPGIGMSHGGATRWLDLGFFSFQPAEVLKFASVAYLATIFSGDAINMRRFTQGSIFALIVIGLSGAILALQPDFGTVLVIATASISLLIAAGARWTHLATIFLILLIAAAIVVSVKPYVLDRIMTFISPHSTDAGGSAYQISQSLIAIGSGEIAGRGFGQSVQKFQYLPEPVGDSIFAVAGEEFGFFGTIALICLYLLFAFRGFAIAHNAKDKFGGLLVLGIVILIVSQSFVNIASMLGIFPLTGMPLLFVSQGGTALFFALLEVGIILNVSRRISK